MDPLIIIIVLVIAGGYVLFKLNPFKQNFKMNLLITVLITGAICLFFTIAFFLAGVFLWGVMYYFLG